MLTRELYDKWALQEHIIATGTNKFSEHIRLTQDLKGTLRIYIDNDPLYIKGLDVDTVIRLFNNLDVSRK